MLTTIVATGAVVTVLFVTLATVNKSMEFSMSERTILRYFRRGAEPRPFSDFLAYLKGTHEWAKPHHAEAALIRLENKGRVLALPDNRWQLA